MPIYEYTCAECDHQFEALVSRGSAPACPACQSQKLDKHLSVFAVNSKDASLVVAPCGACGDPRGAGACSRN